MISENYEVLKMISKILAQKFNDLIVEISTLKYKNNLKSLG